MLPHPLNINVSWLFLLTECVKALVRDSPGRSKRFHMQDHFSDCDAGWKLAEQRSISFSLLLFLSLHYWKAYKEHNINNSNFFEDKSDKNYQKENTKRMDLNKFIH